MPRKKHRIRKKINIGRDNNNKIIYKWISGFTQAEVKQKEIALYAQNVSPVNIITINKGSTNFETYVEKWYQLYKLPKLRPTSKEMYDNLLKTHILPKFGNTNIEKITDDNLQNFINDYSKKSKSLISKLMMCLKQIFQKALQQDIIKKDPMQSVEPPTGTTKQRMPLDYDLVPALTQKLLKDQDGLLVLLMLHCGLRRGETLGLKYSDISETSITINRAIAYVGNTAIVGETKTSAAHRTIPLPNFIREIIPNKSSNGFIFGDENPWTEKKLRRTWERLQKNIPEIKGYSPHAFRHTYTMLLRRAGVDAVTAQYLLGHSDYEVTANIYTHIDKHDISDAMQKLQSIY